MLYRRQSGPATDPKIEFLGGLQVRLDLLKQNFLLSVLAAATGVCFPIGLSYLLLYLGYGYGMCLSFFLSSSLYRYNILCQ